MPPSLGGWTFLLRWGPGFELALEIKDHFGGSFLVGWGLEVKEGFICGVGWLCHLA